MTPRILTIKENILGANSEKAESNRRNMDNHQVRMITLTSAPGSGKTSLILQTINRLKDHYRIAVIEGSIVPSIDAEKIMRLNIPVAQINLSGGCHLDAQMIRTALDTLDLEEIDLLLLENVGNLVCTADFDLGAHKGVVILSIPEGDDKLYKYPGLFIEADAVVINKIDVRQHFDFKLNAFPEIIGGINPAAKIFELSAKTGEGLDDWISWIEKVLQ